MDETEKFKALNAAKDNIKLWGNKDPICPHCGQVTTSLQTKHMSCTMTGRHTAWIVPSAS